MKKSINKYPYRVMEHAKKNFLEKHQGYKFLEQIEDDRLREATKGFIEAALEKGYKEGIKYGQFRILNEMISTGERLYIDFHEHRDKYQLVKRHGT